MLDRLFRFLNKFLTLEIGYPGIKQAIYQIIIERIQGLFTWAVLSKVVG